VRRASIECFAVAWKNGRAMAERTTCCVVGGGPAGMVLALLLARSGAGVTVLEKHGDFLRGFRGDTVHPSTLSLLDELGLGPRFAALPQRRVSTFQLPAGPGGPVLTVAGLGVLRPPYNYIAMVPRWDLLNLLADEARREPAFGLRLNTEAIEFLQERGRVMGVRYRAAGAGGDRGRPVHHCHDRPRRSLAVRRTHSQGDRRRAPRRRIGPLHGRVRRRGAVA
jgi:hypothetical protein